MRTEMLAQTATHSYEAKRHWLKSETLATAGSNAKWAEDSSKDI